MRDPKVIPALPPIFVTPTGQLHILALNGHTSCVPLYQFLTLGTMHAVQGRYLRSQETTQLKLWLACSSNDEREVGLP